MKKHYPMDEMEFWDGYRYALDSIECNRKRQRRRIARRIGQVAFGAACAAVGLASAAFLDGDATAAVFMVPLGVYIAFTREDIFAGEGAES